MWIIIGIVAVAFAIVWLACVGAGMADDREGTR
jgi:hypothetical protein